MNIDRREFIIGLSTSAIVLVSGCATFRRDSEIEAAFADLEELLHSAAADDADKVVSIAEQMKSESRVLLDTHATFVANFNDTAADRTATQDDLNTLVDGYLTQRKTQRDALLHLQDELHAALPADVWTEVLDVLNRKSQAVAAGTI